MINALFTLKVIKFLPKIRMILNVDDTWLTRSLKKEYSWIERGKSKWICNSKFTDSISLMTTISTDGWSLTAAYSKCVNGLAISKYLESLANYLQRNTSWKISEILILLDNWPINHSKIVINQMKRMKINAIFLPSYSPELAPIE